MKQFSYACLGILVLAGAASPGLFAQTRSANNRTLVIRKSGSSYLGIGVAEVDAERAKALKLNETRGVEVKSVDSSSPAAKAGVKEGDVVLEYNGQRIEGTEQFVRLVHETPADRQVKLLVSRNGATETLTATIGRRSEQFSFHSGDDDSGDLTIEMPTMPPTPPMPPMPPMPDVTMPEMPRVFGSMRSTMLGIDCEAMGSQLAEYFGVKEGVLVRSVTHNSAAEKAGMRAGDVITKIDGEAVTSVHEISSQLRAARGKHTFPIVVMRDKKEVTLTVTLESSGRGMRPIGYSGRWC